MTEANGPPVTAVVAVLLVCTRCRPPPLQAGIPARLPPLDWARGGEIARPV